jgi:predicted  nucleic acid-binding Zn-ribbon protein
MRYRCPECGYVSGILYPMTSKEWNQSCPSCGNDELEFFHIGYKDVRGHWVLCRNGKAIGYDPCDGSIDYEV